MERLHIEPTRDTPEVIFSPSTKTLKLLGNSFPSNTADFYVPLIEWLESLVQHPQLDQLKVVVFFNYINTSSTKMLMRMFEIVEQQYLNKGRKAEIFWHFDEEDNNIEDLGEDLKEYVSIPFTLIKEDHE